MLLANQLRILQRLNPNEDYSLQLEIVEKGYEYLYDELTNELLDPPAPTMGPEVYAIFDMFRSLRDSIDILPDKNGIELERAQFRGYDGNEETQHYAFARFLIERKELYPESKPAWELQHALADPPDLPPDARGLALAREVRFVDDATRSADAGRDHPGHRRWSGVDLTRSPPMA